MRGKEFLCVWATSVYEETLEHGTACTYEGLGSYVFTNNIQRWWRVAEALEYGLVGVNEGVISTEVHVIPY